jgi:hypothetical protein
MIKCLGVAGKQYSTSSPKLWVRFDLNNFAFLTESLAVSRCLSVAQVAKRPDKHMEQRRSQVAVSGMHTYPEC